ncbi:MAG TPA: prenyltransferase/squalene oxidase repeat-containing protein [Dehalococcoidia bacterium]|nr:prenyltransferase/squalene oxidase repeat-containing protein [Dehalococcoidia bacterium]
MRLCSFCVLILLASGASAQSARAPWPTPAAPTSWPEVTPELIDEAIATGVKRLVEMQEGDPKAEWPYEGVYRVGGEIPIGYRVGGTAIVVQALLLAPGYEDDDARRQAVERAVAFICDARDHPAMSVDDYAGGYDVRAWGYIEGAACLSRLISLKRVPHTRRQAVDETLAWYVEGIHKMEIPVVGGWNYARGPRDQQSAPSPFMTARALQALFEAASVGLKVDDAVVQRALAVLEKARTSAGSVVYSGSAATRDRPADATPGATGRMTSTEATLALAGRATARECRGAVDAFLTHWPWLEQRRSQPGTHAGPYAVAPYYFMFAHYHAAQAVEQLPPAERAEYRRRVRQVIFRTRQEDGTWNDRVFPRSAAYGTAMALLALMADRTTFSTWSPRNTPDGPETPSP